MKVDRYISECSPETYAVTAYGAAFPAAGLPAEGGWTVVGASDTRTYPEAVCNEIEKAIRTLGYWVGRLEWPDRPSSSPVPPI